MINFKDDEFDVATAITVEETKELLVTGFDYVPEKNNIMLFRRKRIQRLSQASIRYKRKK